MSEGATQADVWSWRPEAFAPPAHKTIGDIFELAAAQGVRFRAVGNAKAGARDFDFVGPARPRGMLAGLIRAHRGEIVTIVGLMARLEQGDMKMDRFERTGEGDGDKLWETWQDVYGKISDGLAQEAYGWDSGGR